MNVFSRTSALAGIAVVALTLSGCGGGDSTAGTSVSSSAVGSSASTDTGGGEVGAEHNAADLSFAQVMIEHHRGAIEMAQLAPGRADSAAVKDLAARIEEAQAPEIESMTSWLQAWDAAMDSTGGMGMGTMGGMDMGSADASAGSSGMTAMPGMMTAEQMAALTAATGADFDRMFLELMVVHHQGAVEMADTELAQGVSPDALALAGSIKTSQTAEIAEMQQLLQGM